MAGDGRDHALSEQEIQNLRALASRMLVETDPEKVQALIEIASLIPSPSEGPFPFRVGAPVRASPHLWIRRRLLLRIPFQIPFLRIECLRRRHLPEVLTIGS